MTAAPPDPPGAELSPPGPGRVFRSRRTVRLSDVDPAGRVRFDAVARYLQDVATDDVRHAGVEDAIAWVVRRTTIAVGRRPVYGEEMDLATRRWPLRRSDIDLYHHVNNVVAWSAAEEEALRLAGGPAMAWGQVEYRRAIEPDETPVLAGMGGEGQATVWLLGADGAPAVSARFGWSAN